MLKTKHRKLFATLLGAGLMIATAAGLQATAEQAWAAGNMDKLIGKSNTIVIATAKGKNSHDMPIYKTKSTKSKKIFKLQGQSSVVCDMSGMKKGTNYTFVKVKLPNCNPNYGYVRVKDFSFGSINTTNFSLSSTKGNNAKRIRACNYSLSLLGCKYSGANSTIPSKGMCCNQLLNKCYQKAGLNYSAGSAPAYNSDNYGKRIKRGSLRAGDIVFYLGANGRGEHNHVAMYLGNGYVVQSTCDKGKTYPRAGVRITRLDFRSSPTDFRCPLK